ncbi:MAG: hypothetical protein HYU02_05690, partial [Thaumarchaeota archaeon]|nr:hypothetical protein [Nitrososphaerota archaeon]
MSSEAIQNCQRAQDNIKKHELKDYQKVFPSIENGLEKTRSFYLDWLEIHREYAYGFQQLQMGYVAKSSATRLVSQWVNTELTSFTNIVDARIPVEAY